MLADKLAADVMKAAKVETFEKRRVVSSEELSELFVRHPLAALGYDFDVPLLDGDHVTDDTGTGFVHTAPGHGTDDYQIWMANAAELKERGIDTTIPFTVDADGVLTADAPGFAGKRVLTEKGDKGDANEAVIAALKRCQRADRARAPEASISRTPGAPRSRSSSATRRSGSSPWTSRSRGSPRAATRPCASSP